MKKKYGLLFLLVALLVVSCSNDDDVVTMPENAQVIPQIAIVGIDLTDGTFPHLTKWDSTFTEAQTDFLPELLDYNIGQLKNVTGNKIGLVSISPNFEFITYDIQENTVKRFDDFFTPENELGDSFILNSSEKAVTYYLDMASTCCNVYLHSYDLNTGNDIEFFLGNLDVSPVQFNTYVQKEKAFLTGVDTFTGLKKLFVHDLQNNLSLGTLDISNYDGYFYNDNREEVYLFDFGGETLTYDILDLNFFSVSESASFVQGVTAETGFNNARFENGKMIFKQNLVAQSSIALDAIYDFSSQTLTSYEGTDLINIIVEETGIGMSILDTEVDLANNLYIVSGTFQEDGLTKGLVVFLTLEKEVLLAVPTGNIRPEEIILLN